MVRKGESRRRAFVEGHSYQADIEPATAAAAAEFHNNNGGSSFYALNGDMATDGFSVGGAPDHNGVRVPEQDHLTGAMNADQFQAHRVRSATNKTNVVAGTWKRDDGANVTDASNIIPIERDAKALGTARGEDAIYDLSNKREIPL